ncbi:MAG: lysophospholipid acyltransferase family protein [Gammaproteobacteria bacterium]
MLSFILRTLWLTWSWLELTLFTLGLYALSWLPRPLTGAYYHHLFRIWCDFFVRALGVRLRLHEKNLKRLPAQYILIANHPSALEDVGIPALFNVYPLAKQGVRDWLLVGRINAAAGTMFVKRDDPESRHAAIDKLIAKLQQGHSVALFPEGGCKGRRIFEKFQTGAFDVSLRTGIPIVPVFIHYEAQETFEWQAPYTLLDKMWHFMTSRNDQANFYVYDAIDPAGFSDKHAYATEVHKRYLHWQRQYLE